jgi:nucleoside 2-deoxyribosyltransferase
MVKIKIFYAASLFNGRENLFNILLVEKLEELGYSVFSAQRDGFEFSKLNEILKNKLPIDEIDIASSDIIYLLDMGFQLPKCDFVIANMDEPLDSGVDIEQTYARLMGKFVIGLRTDVRSPYGSNHDTWGGMHYFPGYQCDILIKHDMLLNTGKEAMESISLLAQKIDIIIQENSLKTGRKVSFSNPVIAKAVERAQKLFSEISDIHSEEGILEIVKRYSQNKSYYSVGIVKR